MSAHERYIPEPTIDDYKAENARLKREVALLRQSLLPDALGQRFGGVHSISAHAMHYATINILERERETLLFGTLKMIASRLKKDKSVLIILHYAEEQRPSDYRNPDIHHDDLEIRIDGRIYET